MPHVTDRGVSIHYEVFGKGFPVVLHTGLGGDRTMWHKAGYVEGLAGYRRILIDHRGHGLSGKPEGVHAHRMQEYVADVVAVLDDLELGGAAFWGYSDGARVGYALAASYADRVAVLIASGTVGREDSLRTRAARAPDLRARGMVALVQSLEKSEGIRLPEWLMRNFLETDVEMCVLEMLGWSEWEGPWALFPRITTPTVIIVGEDEDREGNNRRAVDLLPKGRLVTIPKLGHVGAFLRSDLVLPHALAFLAEMVGAEEPSRS